MQGHKLCYFKAHGSVAVKTGATVLVQRVRVPKAAFQADRHLLTLQCDDVCCTGVAFGVTVSL